MYKKTNEYVTQGTKNLIKAEESQKKGRKCQFYLLCVCMILLMVILFGILGGVGVFTHG